MKIFEAKCRRCGQNLPMAAVDEKEAEKLATSICICRRKRNVNTGQVHRVRTGQSVESN